jgi:hypothetical protein
MALIPAQSALSQSVRKPRKGLRALGLLELPANGKAHLIPIAIMADGKFYDATAYKAAPVPLALYSDTVYEAERTGVSQGLFTVTGALQLKDTWLGEGTWQPGGTPEKARHTDTKPKLDDDEGPPRLRGRGSNRPSPPDNQPQAPPPDAKPSTPAPPTSATPPTAPSIQSAPAEAGGSSSDDNDPNRPVLKRGKSQPSTETHSAPAPAPTSPATVPAKPSSIKAGKETPAVQFIAAISDAAGPDLRPYSYDLKPAEEQHYRKKITVLATEAVQVRAREIVPVMPGTSSKPATPQRGGAKGKQPQPTFDDVHFNAFDVWNINEPVFVFSATAHVPPDPRSPASSSDVTYFITVVAKADIYGDLRKLFVNATDTGHLDQTPRMELIDAVDADGDSRGELLFRQIYDNGVSWAVYRATADQLYPLYEGTPTAQVEKLP